MLCRAGEPHIFESPLACFFKTHRQFAAFGTDPDFTSGTSFAVHCGSEGRSRDTCATGQRLIFNAPFVSENFQAVSHGFHKIDIHPLLPKPVTVPDNPGTLHNVEVVEVFHKDHIMRRTGIQQEIILSAFHFVHVPHVQGNGRAFFQNGFVSPVNGDKRQPLKCGEAQLPGKGSDAPSSVATHGALTAIGVEIHHPEIITIRWFQQDEAVGPHPVAAVANTCN